MKGDEKPMTCLIKGQFHGQYPPFKQCKEMTYFQSDLWDSVRIMKGKNDIGQIEKSMIK